MHYIENDPAKYSRNDGFSIKFVENQMKVSYKNSCLALKLCSKIIVYWTCHTKIIKIMDSDFLGWVAKHTDEQC